MLRVNEQFTPDALTIAFSPMPSDPAPFDFFVSYARADNTTGWSTRFVEELLAEHRRFVGADAGGAACHGGVAG